MEPRVVRFLTGRFTLFEIDEARGAADLAIAFEQEFGDFPDFTPNGDAVSGFHTPGATPEERKLFVTRAANEEAVRSTIRLLIARYGLTKAALLGPTAARHAVIPPVWELDDDADEPLVRVWPIADRPIQDSILVEYVERQGSFVGLRLDGSVFVAQVAKAHAFQSEEIATAWVDENENWKRVRLVFRSVALAEHDRHVASC